jgi:hypothetical protein
MYQSDNSGSFRPLEVRMRAIHRMNAEKAPFHARTARITTKKDAPAEGASLK